MSKRAWFPFYVADWEAKTFDLDAAEQGVYLAMLRLAWKREDAALPNDIKWLKHALKCSIANFHGHQFNRIVPGLLEQFWTHCADGKFRNKRLCQEREKTVKRSANGKQMADKRWSETRNINGLASRQAMLSTSTKIRRAEGQNSMIVKLVENGRKSNGTETLEEVVRRKGWSP